jgi:hypothetical protein
MGDAREGNDSEYELHPCSCKNIKSGVSERLLRRVQHLDGVESGGEAKGRGAEKRRSPKGSAYLAMGGGGFAGAGVRGGGGEGCGGDWGRRGRLARRSVKKLCVLAGFSKIRIQVPGKEGDAREMRFFNFDRPPSIVAGQSRMDRAEKG